MDGLKDLQKKYLSLIDSQKDLNLLEEVRVSILGKKGELSLKMRELGTMSPDEKQSIGPVLNNLRNEVTDKFLSKKYELEEIIKGDTIFCATGITSGDLVKGIKFEDDKYVSETLVTHKSSRLKKIVTIKNSIDL